MSEGFKPQKLDLDLSEGGKQTPDIVDIGIEEKLPPSTLTDESSGETVLAGRMTPEAIQAKLKFDAEQAALAEKLAQQQGEKVTVSPEAVKAERARIKEVLAKQKAEAELVRQAALEAVQERLEAQKRMAQPPLEATNPSGTRPEDTTVN